MPWAPAGASPRPPAAGALGGERAAHQHNLFHRAAAGFTEGSRDSQPVNFTAAATVHLLRAIAAP